MAKRGTRTAARRPHSNLPGKENRWRLGFTTTRHAGSTARLGRFVSADSMIPEPGNPLAWDRYLYALGNPLKYTDPSGHEVCDEEGNCLDGGKYRKVNGQTQVDWWAKIYGIKFSKNWTNQNKISVLSTVIRVGYKFADTLNNGMTAWGAFRGVYGTLTFALSSETQEYWAQYGGGTITYYAGAQQWATLTAHELGHAFNARIANNSGTTPYNTLFNQGIWLDDGRQLAGYMRGHTVSGTGFTCNGQKCVDSEGNPIPANHYWRQNDGFGFSHSKDLTANEDFADMFGNWAVGSFPNDDAGVARLNFMTTNMSEWIHSAMGR